MSILPYIPSDQTPVTAAPAYDNTRENKALIFVIVVLSILVARK